MFRSLPPTLRGVVAAALLALNTLFWCGLLFALALVKLVVPARRVRIAVDRALNEIATRWVSGNSAWMRATQRTRWDVAGFEGLAYHGWYLVNCNHQSWVDILVLQHLLNRRIPMLKFFLKRQLIYVPVIGLAWWALDFPFMRRHSDSYLRKHPEKRFDDLDASRRACEKFALVPTSVMNFAEGTRFTRDKQRSQRSPYRHLLKPKAGAMALALDVLGERFDSLLDFTIVYPSGVPTFWQFLCGNVTRVVVRAERVPIPRELLRGDYARDPAYRKNFQRWLQALWSAKDRRIDELVRAPAAACWIAACALAFWALASTAEAAGEKKAKPDGQAVPVTAEMIGAGIVSSGAALPPIPPVTGSHDRPVTAWSGPLPHPIVIADRRNNRLIEIAPDKRIVWEFPSPNLKIYRGNDDVFFSPDGRRLMVNEEDNYDIHIVDYEKRELTWTFGASDTKGTKPGYFNYPDDAHLLADGKVVTADIRNCRIQFIDPEASKVIGQWGKEGNCRHDPPHFLAYPNGATPLANGDILVTEITDAWITRMTRDGEVVWSVRAPRVRYPSDAFPTRDGQVIVADFSKPGRIVIFDPRSGKVTWEYFERAGERMLDHPSLALELANGNILANDDARHRVIVIDRASKAIVWQYGVTDTPGHKPGYLFYPDGMDLDIFRDWKGALAGH